MATATVQVSGVRCERCIGRLAGALRSHDGIEYANANLMGQVTLACTPDTAVQALRTQAAAYQGVEVGAIRLRTISRL